MDGKDLLKRLVAQVRREGPYHGLLMRQLRKAGAPDVERPPDAEGWKRLLALVDESYREADRDRASVERSMALSSDEMRELHERLKSQNAHLERLLGSYVPEEVSRSILADPEAKLRPGGELALVSVLFARIRGLEAAIPPRDAQRTLGALNTVFAKLVPCILEEGGTPESYQGEALQSVFGAPTAHGDDAARAARAALAMQASVAILREREPGLGAIVLSAGVATGYAAVGNLGAEPRMAYTCVGEVPTAARALEAAAPDAAVLVCAETAEVLHGRAKLDDAPPVAIRGRRALLTVFRLRELA